MAKLYYVTFACLAALAFVAIVTSSTTTAPVPAFLWSGSSFFTGKNLQVLDKVTDTDIDVSLKAILTQQEQETPLKGFIAGSSQAPEIVLLFLEPQLRSDMIPLFGSAYATEHDGGAFSNVKTLVESTAASSLVIPYAEFSETADVASFISDAALAAGASVIIATSQEEAGLLDTNNGVSNSVIARDDLAAYLSTHSELFSNNKADVIIVRFVASDEPSAFSSADAFIGEITSAVASASNGAYIALFTSAGGCVDPVATATAQTLAPTKVIELSTLEEHGVFKTAASKPKDTNNPDATYGTGYFIKGVWEAIVVVVVLLVILFIGLCCTMSIQAPKRYEAPPSNAQRQ